MDVGETAAIQYTYLDRENKEVIRLYRLVVDDSKTTTKVYSKTAQREHDRSVVDPNDVSSVAKFASDAKAWEPGSDWEWLRIHKHLISLMRRDAIRSLSYV